ncbi:MAG: hypothetical protein QOJ87_141 [Verrucomicrobiota bacterium]
MFLVLIAALCLISFSGCDKKSETKLTDLSSGHSKDITLAADIEMPSGNQHGILKLKGEKARTDIEGLGISSIQSASGEMFILNHQTKTIQRQNLEASDASGITQEERAKLSNAFAMRFTGNKEKIAGWDTREFLMMDLTEEVPLEDQIRISAWIAEDFPDGREIQRMLERVAPNQSLVLFQKATGKKFTLPGFALRIEVRKGGNQVMKLTYTAIRPGELPASDFELPKDYFQSLSK